MVLYPSVEPKMVLFGLSDMVLLKATSHPGSAEGGAGLKGAIKYWKLNIVPAL